MSQSNFTIAALFLSLVLTVAGGCAVNPATGKVDTVVMSEKKEISIGREMHEEIIKTQPILQDPGIQEYIDRIGQKVAAKSHRSNIKYTFTVIDSPDINAFALPGGYIYIHRGLLGYLKSEAELAAVLGHEVGHVTARHVVRQRTAATTATGVSTVLAVLTGSSVIGNLGNMAGAAVVRGYGREHELEADKLGAEYLFNSGYDPQAMIDVIGVLKDHEQFAKLKAREEGKKPQTYHGLFASHPRNDTRLQKLVANAGTLSESEGEDNTLLFQAKITGLEFGEGSNSGVHRGSRFYHKPMNFTFAFPNSWKLHNSPNAVVVYPSTQDAFLQLQVQGDLANLTPETFIKERLKHELTEGEIIDQYDLRGYTGIVAATDKRGPVRVAVIFHNNQAFYFTGVNRRPNAALNYDPFFTAAISSFRPLKAEDYKQAAALKIKYIEADGNTNYESLARHSKIPKYAEEQLRLLNAQYPRGEPEPGQLIKIVE